LKKISSSTYNSSTSGSFPLTLTFSDSNSDSLTSIIEKLIEKMHWQDDDNFDDTPQRFTTWLKENQGLSKADCKRKSIEDLKKRFATKNQQMVVVGPTKTFSLCPHHLLPIEYDSWVGYIPNKWAVGISKLSRVPLNFSRYPFIQEDYTEEIADAIMENLQPKGVMVVVKGTHNCMRIRGVKQPDAVTMSSALKGVFLKPPKGKDPRSELLKLIEIQ